MNEIATRFIEHSQAEMARSISLENLSVIWEIRDESSQAAELAGLSVVYDVANLEIADEERKYLAQLVLKAER
jgi:hypothetical protein